jgi:hypothetical protein
MNQRSRGDEQVHLRRPTGFIVASAVTNPPFVM